ncbi:sensor domain-containing diguanylate cyclase [Pseudoalteromonas sp. PS5]|uniref:GGDEF domain-containing protein n=1 Tax=Pseudoalteromonas sp. PS5 TaxID=1437473 RepID=UPI000FFF57DD|nr:sensor domain-containing diguanylate cyclase [Pseudoalteromonas sp. PS5]RXF03044.1 GGDEF domain-containing protein [Pseudoalteromonas sp. PS5]
MMAELPEVIDSMTDIVSCLNTSESLEHFLLNVHCIVQKITYADNFYVVLQRQDGSFEFPYFHDVKDSISLDELNNLTTAELNKTLTYYALSSDSVKNYTEHSLKALTSTGVIDMLGSFPKQWLCFPLMNKDKHLGAFVLQSYRRQDEYSDSMVDLLYTVSHVIASAMDAFANQQALIDANQALRKHELELEKTVQARTFELQASLSELQSEIDKRKALQEKLEFDAYHDNLTQLANRKYLLNELQKLSARSSRQPINVYLGYLDLDNFKPINDTHGHHSGDEVLVHVARRLQETVREYDFVCRIGGDEFVFVINESIASDMLSRLTERIRSEINQDILLSNGQLVQVGCSIGVVIAEGVSVSAESLLKRADNALYEAKKQGKNQVSFSFEPR